MDRGVSNTRSDIIQLDQMTIIGESNGGRETWFRVQPPGIAFDVGRGPEQLGGVRAVFLSHGHMDHAAGLPVVLSQRALHGRGELRIHAPLEVAQRVKTFIEAAAELEECDYDFSIHPLEAGEEIALGDGFAMRAFATDHVVPSLGFHLVQRVQRLLPRYRGLSGPEIATLRGQGVDVSSSEVRPLVSYLGDTRKSVFDAEPAVFGSRVLLMECTFLDQDLRERAARYGHLHFSDIEEVAARFDNEIIVLHHLSRRASPDALRSAVESRLPDLAPRVRILGVSSDA